MFKIFIFNYIFFNIIFEHSEILRVIESLQLTEKHKVATPVDWKVCIYFILLIKTLLHL